MSELLRRLTEYCRAPPFEKKKQPFDAMAAYRGDRANFRRDYRLYCHFLEKSDGRISLDDCADLVGVCFITLTDDSRKDKAGNPLPPLIETYDSTRGKFLSWVLGIADKIAAGQWREDQHEEAMLLKYSQDVTGEVHSSFKYTHRRDDFGSVITTRNQDGEAVNREMVWNGRRPTEEIALRNFQHAINRQKIMILKAFPPIHPAMQTMTMRQWYVIERYDLHDNDPDRLEEVNERLVANGHPPLKSLSAYRSELSRARKLVRSTWPLGDITGTISGDFRYDEVPEEPPCPTYAERPDHWKEAYTLPRDRQYRENITFEVSKTQKISKKVFEKGPWGIDQALRFVGQVEGKNFWWGRLHQIYQPPLRVAIDTQPPLKVWIEECPYDIASIYAGEGYLGDKNRSERLERISRLGGLKKIFAIPREYPKTYAGYLPAGTAKLKRLEVYRLTGETYELHNITTTAKYEKGPICCKTPR